MLPRVRVQIVNACTLTVITLCSLTWGVEVSAEQHLHAVSILIAILVQ